MVDFAKRRDALALGRTIAGLVVGFLLGITAGLAVDMVLSVIFQAHIRYVIFLKGSGPITVARIFAGNILVALMIHYVPGYFRKHRYLPGLLIGGVGFVLGFFVVTSGISASAFLARLPHTVLEVFAYVIAARGGSLWPAAVALVAGAASEWALVLR